MKDGEGRPITASCSSCGKSSKDASCFLLIALNDRGVFICDACVEICMEMVRERRQRREAAE